MRGTFFAKPLEILIEIEGERWKQGDAILGRVTVRNRGSESVSISELAIELCRAQLSAVKKKAEGAFKPMEAVQLAGELSPGSEIGQDFRFELGLNAPITDSASSAFICCGGGALQLMIEPSLVIQEFTSALQAQHHFGFKSYKQSKAGVGAKFSAPDGQSFAAIEGLMLSARFVEESGTPDLEVSYDFQVKQVGAGALPMKVGKASRQVQQVVPALEYQTPSGRVNFEGVRRFVAEAVSVVEAKVLF